MGRRCRSEELGNAGWAVSAQMELDEQGRKGMLRPPARRPSKGGWYLLLLVQYALALCVPFYNSVEPQLGGFPFFYWFQLLMVLVCAILTAVVYFATDRPS